jgi:hypothetical protein
VSNNAILCYVGESARFAFARAAKRGRFACFVANLEKSQISVYDLRPSRNIDLQVLIKTLMSAAETGGLRSLAAVEPSKSNFFIFGS